ncbi:LytR/AlgR family response regulator transcription factor [Mucilaginibacter sp. P25]|uniref:LytR/AlgR family response regulator transcription factor n=1 Tax=Mucilaginibacter sp. P25 TaxID=3423945 RepID=UPI003D7AEB86
MNVTIIDDEPPAITLLSAYIQRTKFLELHSTFTDPIDALPIYNSADAPQVTFLDIEMPGMNGLDFARLITLKTQIIITSSFRDYGPEAFELSAVDYLVKPFSYERFLDAIKKLQTNRLLKLQSISFLSAQSRKGNMHRSSLVILPSSKAMTT